jgi:hypothetical protein
MSPFWAPLYWPGLALCALLVCIGMHLRDSLMHLKTLLMSVSARVLSLICVLLTLFTTHIKTTLVSYTFGAPGWEKPFGVLLFIFGCCNAIAVMSLTHLLGFHAMLYFCFGGISTIEFLERGRGSRWTMGSAKSSNPLDNPWIASDTPWHRLQAWVTRRTACSRKRS